MPTNGRSVWSKVVVGVLALVVVFYLFLTWWWDKELPLFDPASEASARASIADQQPVVGYTTTATLVHLIESLLDKRGGYLSNDIAPPGLWMDNIPNWEFGALVQIRDMGRSLRIDFSRSQSQSNEDPNLAEAEGKFFYDNSSWIFPTSEGQYREGIEYVEKYLVELANTDAPSAQFYARADNLRNWLVGVSTRLGGLSQRLSESVGKRQLDLGVAGDSTASQATESPAEWQVKTPWTQIDDVFYEARGQCWALIHLLLAIEHDFGDVLDDKNARVSLQQIIRELEPTQETVWSPVVLNGGGLGMFANHSLVMASYISRANAAIIDLENLLASG